MVSSHVDIKSARPRDLLQLPLWTPSPPQVVQLAHRPQHGSQPDSTRLSTEARMGTEAIMDVAIEWPIDVDLVWIREVLSLAVGVNEAAEDLVARLDVDLAAVVIDRCVRGGETIRTRRAIEANAFHGIVKQLLVGFGSRSLCQLVDRWEVLWMIEIVVNYLSKYLSLVCNHLHVKSESATIS